MTASDFRSIILNSFIHETKLSYLKSRLLANGCLPTEYARGLLKAFESFKEDIDEHFLITLRDEKSFVSMWFSENLNQFMDPHDNVITYEEFWSSTRIRIPNFNSKDSYEYLYRVILTKELLDSYEPILREFITGIQPERTKIIGFETKFDKDDQKKDLFEKMQGDYIDSSLENFIAVLTKESFVENFEPVKWILAGKKDNNGKKGVHKTSLREFLELVVDMDSELPLKQDKINELFRDKDGNIIKLAPKQKSTSPHLSKFEHMIEGASLTHRFKNLRNKPLPANPL